MPSAVAPLFNDDAIAADIQAARDAIDALLWRRDIRAEAAQVAVESIDRGARDSAAIDGADQVGVDDSPMGRVRASAIAVTSQALGQADVWPRAPLQVLAHLHAVAAHGFSDELGRPRSGDVVDDPMHIGMAPPAAMVSPRLTLLSDVVTGDAVPAMFEAALVHGELMALRPFAWGNGLVARATVRTILGARGVDPSMFSVPELGMFELGRSAYVSAVRNFQAGRIEGMRAYISWFTAALQAGTRVR
jgi:hypothetical protein